MKKKKILFINGHLNTGGCEKSLVDVLRHFDYEKYDVDLLLLESLGDYISQLPEEVSVYLYSLNHSFGPLSTILIKSLRNKDFFSLKFRIIYMFSSKMNKSFYKYALKSFPKLQSEYDVVIAYRPGICTDLAAYMIRAKKRVSWWHHGEMLYKNGQIHDLGETYSHMDSIVAVSQNTSDMLKQYFPGEQGKIVVINNMIDQQEIIDKSIEKMDCSYPSGKNILISVGRFSPEKNMGLCVETAKLLSEKYPEFQYAWYLIGDGEQLETVKKSIIEYSLEEKIILLGKKSNPYPYMKNADILVHPSLVESQGLTILESMTLHIPVIVVSSEGPKEYIKNGFNGILCNPVSEEVVAAIRLLGNQDTCRNIEDNTYCPLEFSPEQVMKKIEILLEK